MLAGASRGTLTDPTTMKNLLTSALLAVAASAFVAAPSFAGCCFGLCYKHCGCCGCGAQFCVRQYNAFSPVCCGTVFCDGCCPFGSGGGYGGYGPGYGGCGPCAGGMCPGGMCPGGLNYSGVLGSCTPGCDGACLGSLPPAESTSGVPATVESNPIVSPSALPSQMPPGPVSQTINDRGIQNTSYRPASPPATVPVRPIYAQPQMIAAPSYWGN
jgi:hypothetical protein